LGRKWDTSCARIEKEFLGGIDLFENGKWEFRFPARGRRISSMRRKRDFGWGVNRRRGMVRCKRKKERSY